MKKLLLSICLLAASISGAYASTNTGQYFTLDNQTDSPLRLKIQFPTEDAKIVVVPPNSQSDRIYGANHDEGLVEYGYRTAPFYVSLDDPNNKKDPNAQSPILLKGLVVFHADSSNSKHSYLAQVSSAGGVTMDQSYTCRYEGNVPFENKITVKKTGPFKDPLSPDKPTGDMECNMVKNSSLDYDYGLYQISCFDGLSETFEQITHKGPVEWRPKGSYEVVWGGLGVTLSQMLDFLVKTEPQQGKGYETPEERLEKAKKELLQIFDARLGNYFCKDKAH